MPCTNCNSSTPVSIYDIQYLYSSTCTSCNDPECGSSYTNAKCVFYDGPSLECSEIDNSDNLEVIIQKIDEKLCSATGDYSTYNFNCLDDDTAITTEAQFVNAITAYACSLRTDLDEFTETTFPAYQDEVTGIVQGISGGQGITSCSEIGIVSGDDLSTVLGKLSAKLCTVYTGHLDLTGVNWGQCFTVVTPPTTVPAAFDLLIDHICLVKTTAESSAVLPTFNNIGSCLASPGASDTLVATVGKIKDRLCLTPTLDNDNLSSTCISIPSSDTDLEGLLQNVLDKLDELSQAKPTFDSGDFDIVAGGDPCDGVIVSLATPSTQDRFVAINVGDTSPGTLSSKITAGANITLDTTTTPGTMIVSSSAGSSVDEKVKAFVGDPNASSYLINKLEGTSGDGIDITTTSNVVDGKVSINPSVNWTTFVTQLIDALENDDDLKTQFCNLIASCPSPCDPPTNIEVTYSAPTTSSTTTTTTTT